MENFLNANTTANTDNELSQGMELDEEDETFGGVQFALITSDSNTSNNGTHNQDNFFEDDEETSDPEIIRQWEELERSRHKNREKRTSTKSEKGATKKEVKASINPTPSLIIDIQPEGKIKKNMTLYDVSQEDVLMVVNDANSLMYFCNTIWNFYMEMTESNNLQTSEDFKMNISFHTTSSSTNENEISFNLHTMLMLLNSICVHSGAPGRYFKEFQQIRSMTTASNTQLRDENDIEWVGFIVRCGEQLIDFVERSCFNAAITAGLIKYHSLANNQLMRMLVDLSELADYLEAPFLMALFSHMIVNLLSPTFNLTPGDFKLAWGIKSDLTAEEEDRISLEQSFVEQLKSLS